jgi:hypothetical protein
MDCYVVLVAAIRNVATNDSQESNYSYSYNSERSEHATSDNTTELILLRQEKER